MAFHLTFPRPSAPVSLKKNGSLSSWHGSDEAEQTLFPRNSMCVHFSGGS